MSCFGVPAKAKAPDWRNQEALAGSSSVFFTTAIPAVIISSTCAASSSGSRSAVQTNREPPLMSGSTLAAPL